MSFNIIPKEIYINHVLPYIVYAPRKLLDWIDIDKIGLIYISDKETELIKSTLSIYPDNLIKSFLNVNQYIESSNLNPDMIKQLFLIHLSRQTIDKVSNDAIDAMKLTLELYPYEIPYGCWMSLAGNTSNKIIEFFELALELNPDEIQWGELAANTNPKMLEFVKENIDQLTECNWYAISHNNTLASSVAMEILKSHPEIICWEHLSLNDSDAAIELLKSHPDKIDWQCLSRNKHPEAIELLKSHPDKIDWGYLSLNNSDDAIELLRDNIDTMSHMFNWSVLSRSRNPKVIKLLKDNMDMIDWSILSSNNSDEAVELLKSTLVPNKNKIDWTKLSSNSSDKVIDLLSSNINKIDWERISGNRNPKIFELLKENKDVMNNNFNWRMLSMNQNIFEIDHVKWKQRIEEYYCKL
jgi:hypothetical protein